MARTLTFVAALMLAASAGYGGAMAAAVVGEVAEIKAVCRNGQSFITWKDAAEGEADAKLRYALFRSNQPITQANLPQAELLQKDIFYNSARLFGYAFSEKSRLDPAKPMVVLEEGGRPLPMWSGVTTVTVKKAGKSHYAVVATTADGNIVGKVVPGKSATTEPVEETAAPLMPIKYNSAKTNSGPTVFRKKQPLFVQLHGSNSYAGDKGYGPNGDDYLYFATPEMGYRDGLQGTFQVRENRTQNSSHLVLSSVEAIECPGGNPLNFTKETFWFGYLCAPQWAKDKELRAYPFTERRMLWIIGWVIKTYDVDADRVCAGGGSMGAWGSSTFAFRRPEIFAAVYPNRPRTRQRALPDLSKLAPSQKDSLMDDDRTSYFERQDVVKFATEHHEDLPVYLWCCGRRDGFASWKEQVDMVKAMTASHHGFAFAWNDGDHRQGAAPMDRVTKYYGPDKFARNQSYPAFGNSSIDDDIGSGDLDGNKKVKDGAAEGGINLGFLWKGVVDEANRWSVTLANDLAKVEMTVDVTPRRCQRFRLKAGEKLKWTDSAGSAGLVTADPWGLVTVEKVRIAPSVETVLHISRQAPSR